MKKWLKEHQVELFVGFAALGIFACGVITGYKMAETEALAEAYNKIAQESHEIIEEFFKQLEEDPEVEITHF